MKRAIFSFIIRVRGNVNADESVGNRITIKKMISSDGNVLPFVSARAIRRGIRERLLEKGLKIDPLNVEGEGSKSKLFDVGDPIEYVDDDLFGYLAIKKRGQESGQGIPRFSPVKVSYLVALRHTEITVERGGRFPRPNTNKEVYPTPFEVEVADFLGLLNIVIEDYIGKFDKRELREDILNKHKNILQNADGKYILSDDERKKRLKALLEIIIKEGWKFPRAARSLNLVDYYYAVVALTNKLVPLGGFVDLDDEKNLDMTKIESFLKFYGDLIDEFYVIKYKEGKVLSFDKQNGKLIEAHQSLDDIITAITNYLI